MSDAWDGLPPEEWRDKDGWHWLGDRAGDVWPQPWWARSQRWGPRSPTSAARDWYYLSPCLSPDEIAALRARAERVEAAQASLTGVATMQLSEWKKQADLATREVIRTARAEALREAVAIIRERVQARIEPHLRAASSKIEAGIAGGMAAMADDVAAAVHDLIMRSVPVDRALIEKEKPDAAQ